MDIDGLKKRLNQLQEEAEALEQVIYILEKENSKKSTITSKKGRTKSGLSFSIKSDTRPGIEPAENKSQTNTIEDDFDVSSIPNRGKGILDL